ncbi:hypothetical protein AVEN_238125-1 [Araneus ventricosus]|uniref:Uncharacterized protein n=1 Tax=Araneus ventricosus TaxID=182803 RepID=A0A4Y2WM40_ARAVE|nr:hypothetical protein AVEN_238125-1 [Araneus ventricosus]
MLRTPGSSGTRRMPLTPAQPKCKEQYRAVIQVRIAGTTEITRTTGSQALPRHPEKLNDSRCNSSSTEAGDLIASHQATARSLQEVVRTMTAGRSQSPAINTPSTRSENPVTYPATSHIHIFVVPSGEIEKEIRPKRT